MKRSVGMNFASAFSALVRGESITKTGLNYRIKMVNQQLVKVLSSGMTFPFSDFECDFTGIVMEGDWYSCTDNKEPVNNRIVIGYKKIQQEDWIDPVAPFHAYNDDRGFDLTCVAKKEIRKGVWEYHSGLAFSFPEGIDAEVRARSSVHKTGMILSNGIGTVDHGYTGEVKAVFYEIFEPQDGNKKYGIGERFCQLVIPGVDPSRIVFEEIKELPETNRGNGGYGSTGK